MKKQVAVIGLGRFGSHLAIALSEARYEVLAIDRNAELVETIAPNVTRAYKADSTNESSLRKLGIDNFDVAIVAVGTSIQDSVLTTILLKKLGVPYIVARADNELHGEILKSIGAHKIIFPERDTALRTGPVMTMKGVNDYIPLGDGSGIIKVKAPSFFVGKTLADVGLGTKEKSNAVVLMIQRGKEGLINPAQEEVISHIDVLIIAGNNTYIDKLLENAEKAQETEEKKRNGSRENNLK